MPITQIQSTLQIRLKFLRLLAVADGVGGWNDHGVDPAKYSRELCRHIETLWNEHFLNYLTNPKKLIIDAAQKTKAQGSSTLAIVTIDDIKPVLYSSYVYLHF